MNDLLKLPVGDNSLQTAFRSLREAPNQAPTQEQLSEQYANFFKPTPQIPVQNNRFERFSLVDPNIQIVLTSTTKTIGK